MVQADAFLQHTEGDNSECFRSHLPLPTPRCSLPDFGIHRTCRAVPHLQRGRSWAFAARWVWRGRSETCCSGGLPGSAADEQREPAAQQSISLLA